MQSTTPPAWFARLPPFPPRPERSVVIVDSQAMSYRLLDGRRTPDYDFLFEDPRVVIQIGRRVIQETLRSVGVEDTGIERDARGNPIRVSPEVLRPGLPGPLNQRMWQQQARLQALGKLVLVGAMLPAQAIVYQQLARRIEATCGRNMGPRDAEVLADALVRRIPLFCDDNACRRAFANGLASEALNMELRAAGLDGFAATLFVP
jgi:hypothetical protein